MKPCQNTDCIRHSNIAKINNCMAYLTSKMVVSLCPKYRDTDRTEEAGSGRCVLCGKFKPVNGYQVCGHCALGDRFKYLDAN